MSISVAVFGGVLAFNGILMAVGWFSFSKIYEILTSDKLGAMLKKNDLLGVHLAFIDITHLSLVIASLLSVLGLVIVLIPAPLLADRVIFASCIGATVYALIRALGATKTMNALVWEDAHLERGPAGLTAIDGSLGK